MAVQNFEPTRPNFGEETADVFGRMLNCWMKLFSTKKVAFSPVSTAQSWKAFPHGFVPSIPIDINKDRVIWSKEMKGSVFGLKLKRINK